MSQALVDRARRAALVIVLWCCNRFLWRSVTGTVPLVVSVASYGNRLASVYQTIETIGLGAERPARLILWLDGEGPVGPLPRSLRRLEKRGLEILYSGGRFGPHTKYFPFVERFAQEGCPLVTADDDVWYPRSWLRDLWMTYVPDQKLVLCYRAHVVGLVEDGIAPYETWGRAASTEPSFRHFATGVSGVLYPPHFLKMVAMAGTQFLTCCPKADDVWLHFQAVRLGFRIRQIRELPVEFLTRSHTQHDALAVGNVAGGQNDAAIRATYTADATSVLLMTQ